MNVTGILEYSLMWRQCLDPGSLRITTYLDQFKYLFYFFFAYHFYAICTFHLWNRRSGRINHKGGPLCHFKQKKFNAVIEDKIGPLCSSYRTMMSHKKVCCNIEKYKVFFFYLITRDNTCMLDGSALNRLTQIK